MIETFIGIEAGWLGVVLTAIFVVAGFGFLQEIEYRKWLKDMDAHDEGPSDDEWGDWA